jgi:hypothetical protein
MSRSRLAAYWVTTGLSRRPSSPPAWPTFSTCKRASTASCASLHFVTPSEQDALAGGYLGVPDPLRARLQRSSH